MSDGDAVMGVPAQRRPPDDGPLPGAGPGGGAQPRYPALIARLVALQDASTRQEAAVHAWHARTLAAATHAIDLSSAAVAEAEEDVARAQETVARVDYAAKRLWGDLAIRLSRRAAKRRGPVPAPTVDGTQPGDQPDQLISQVRARLATAPVVQVLAPWAYPLMALLGAGCAAAVTRLALALAGPSWLRIALPVAAPLLGLLPVRLVARAQRSGLDVWSVAITLLAGAVTAALLFFLAG